MVQELGTVITNTTKNVETCLELEIGRGCKVLEVNVRKRNKGYSGKGSEEVSCRESHSLLEDNQVAMVRILA